MSPGWQVLGSAAAADRALAAGLPRDGLVRLAVARERLRAGVPLDDLQPGLRAAAEHPAAPLYDELLARRLSVGLPTIRRSWR